MIIKYKLHGINAGPWIWRLIAVAQIEGHESAVESSQACSLEARNNGLSDGLAVIFNY